VAADMCKLIGEGLEGAWFCTVESGYERAFKQVFTQVRKGLGEAIARRSQNPAPLVGNHSVTVAICSLCPRELKWRSFKLGDLVQSVETEFADGKWVSWEKHTDDPTRDCYRNVNPELRRRPGIWCSDCLWKQAAYGVSPLP
jgi:hypothetical protein